MLQNNMLYRILSIFGVVIVIFSVIGWIHMQNTNTVLKSDEVRLVAVPSFLDWGTVSAANGIQHKDFLIENNGTEPITIQSISTSCSCTTAKLSTGGSVNIEMPIVVNGGDELTLQVIYDPNFHEAEGAITRFVYIQYQGIEEQTKELSIENSINVIP